MRVLGLSFDFHDSAAAIAENGILLAAAAEERFTRQKHDSSFPRFSIDFCLKQAGCSLADLDKVVFYERPTTKWTRVLASSLAPWPHSRMEFCESLKAWLGKKLWTRLLISNRLEIHPDQIHEIPHHLSHAAQAFLGSGFAEAAVLVADAAGEWNTCSLLEASYESGQPVFRELARSEYPHSLGLFYSAFTEFLGFRAMNDECSLMAIAAFGQPTFLETMGQVLQVSPEGKISLSPEFLDFDRSLHSPFKPKFLEVFGQPRQGGYSFSCLKNRGRASSEEQHFANLAASVQIAFENAILALASALRQRSLSQNLCFAGGTALNCVANLRIVKESGFQKVFVPPDPGDAGAAAGAAMLVSAPFAKSIPVPTVGPYLGEALQGEAEFAEAISLVNVRGLRRYRKLGLLDQPEESWEHILHPREEDFIHAAASHLFEKGILGWVQGQFELGPRALGNRSILIRPDSPELAARLSEKVKERAAFRPYALAITREAAGAILDEPPEVLEQPLLRWMQSAVKVQERWHAQLRPGIHVDGTTRIQIVHQSDNPRFHSLLTSYAKISGAPAVLINTSFNESGYPMVNGPMEALMVFARTAMDGLACGNLMLRKIGAR